MWKDLKSYLAAQIIAKGKDKALNRRLLTYMYYHVLSWTIMCSFLFRERRYLPILQSKQLKKNNWNKTVFLRCLQDIGKRGTNCMQASRINKFTYNMIFSGWYKDLLSKALQTWLLQGLQACNPSKTAGSLRAPLLCFRRDAFALPYGSFNYLYLPDSKQIFWKFVRLHHHTLPQKRPVRCFVLVEGSLVTCMFLFGSLVTLVICRSLVNAFEIKQRNHVGYVHAPVAPAVPAKDSRSSYVCKVSIQIDRVQISWLMFYDVFCMLEQLNFKGGVLKVCSEGDFRPNPGRGREDLIYTFMLGTSRESPITNISWNVVAGSDDLNFRATAYYVYPLVM